MLASSSRYDSSSVPHSTDNPWAARCASSAASISAWRRTRKKVAAFEQGRGDPDRPEDLEGARLDDQGS